MLRKFLKHCSNLHGREVREVKSRRFLGRLWGDREGAAAIEFALLAIPFFMLTIGIIELSVMFTAACLLEGGTSSAARMIRTGELQQGGGDPETVFRDELCSYIDVFLTCSRAQIEVVTMASFSDYETLGATFDEDGNLASRGFNAGDSNDRVLVRVVYNYQMMTPFVGQLLAGPDMIITFMSTVVMQTEPYDFSENVG